MARIKTEIQNISFDDQRKKYYITLNYGYESGKQIKKTKTAKTKTEAKKILKEFEADKIRGELTTPRTETLADWLDYWMTNVVELSREKTTFCGYKIIVDKHIVPCIGNIPLQKLTPQKIQEFYTLELNAVNEKGNHTLSSNTVKKHHTLLKTALEYAVKQDIIRVNPAKKVSAPKYVKPEISFYTIDSLKILFDLIDSDYVLKPAVYLAGKLGLRREEIAGLKWEHLDFENNLIYIKEVRAMANREIIIKQTKNISSTRRLSFGDDLKSTLQEIKIAHEENKKIFSLDDLNTEELSEICIDSDYVVTNELGIPIHPGYLSTLFGKFVKVYGIPHITLHGLRHTIASVGNDAGLTLYDISKILGHSSPDVTGKIYTHLFDETQRDAMAKIQDRLK